MPTLATTFDGLAFANPFLIASGPPGTNLNVIRRAFREGWGGVVAKTVCLDHRRIVNVSPRYAKLTVHGEVVGWENIELISDRPFDTWLEEFRACKDESPESVLIASVMEELNRDAWHEVVERTQATGVDALELNMSCPHGLPERRMGSAMGEDPELLAKVCGWVMEVARVPVWVKLTPNVTRIEDPGAAALRVGCQGLTAINTIRSIMGVNLETLRPEPTVAGHSTTGGYSSIAVRPIALRMIAELASLRDGDFPGRTISAVGGVETGEDAAQFILLGANTVQACTSVMKHGYGIVSGMKEQLVAFMERHGFETLDAFRGKSLSYLTSHSELVRLDRERRGEPASTDASWTGDEVVRQSEALVGEQ